MHCPFCNYDDTKVVDSRLTADNLQVRRRRECLRCNSRFSTYETIELNLPRVVKKDNAREAFNLDKLKKGFYLALEKRPIASDLIEKSIDNIVKNIRSSVEKEIDSKKSVSWLCKSLEN
jgi:transcriptional repressor NrdR